MDTLEDIGWGILFLASLAVPAISLTAPLAIWWSVRCEVRKRRQRQGCSDRAGGSELASVRFGLHHLAHWMPLLLIALAVASAIGLRSGWTAAIVPIAASGYLAYRWQIALRRRRVEWPIVYALTLWMLPQLACTATILTVGRDLAWFGNPYSIPEWVWENGYRQVIIQITRLLVATALLAVVALVVAMVLARSKRPPISPHLVASVSFAHAFVFWFANPFGFMLGTLSMVLIGHAVSREVRAVAFRSDSSDGHSDGDHDQQQATGIIFAGLVATAMAAAIAYGIYWTASDANQLSDAEYGGIPIMLSWILGPVLIAATVWVLCRGKLRDYGAAICGLSWIPISYVLYGFAGARTYMEYWLHAWSYWQIAGAAIAATVMLAIMWWVFGPGTVTGKTADASNATVLTN